MMQREEVLIVTWLKLPEPMRAYVKEGIGHRFHNDVMVEWASEFQPAPSADEDWSTTLTQNSIDNYWRDQMEFNGYTGSREAFMTAYGLVFEDWLVTQEIDLTGIKKIIIDIMW